MSMEIQVPEEIIIEILSRLPVKPLLRFKSVCKNWYATIKTPNFITKHLRNHYENGDGVLLLQRFIPKSEKFCFEICTDINYKTLPNVDRIVDSYMLNARFPRYVLGPLNGLYLFSDHKNRIALWNPATREFKPLPLLPIADLYGSPTLGLGFDPSTNDYKVISTIRRSPDGNNIFLLYTLSSDSWKVLNFDDVFPNYCFFVSSYNNTYLNGYYYWAVHLKSVDDNREGECTKIFGFDMVNEVFLEIKGPTVPFSDIIIYNGRTAALVFNIADVEIWVMESEGFWTKQSTIGYYDRLSGYLISRDFNFFHKESLVTLKSENGKREDDDGDGVSNNLVAPFRDLFNI